MFFVWFCFYTGGLGSHHNFFLLDSLSLALLILDCGGLLNYIVYNYDEIIMGPSIYTVTNNDTHSEPAPTLYHIDAVFSLTRRWACNLIGNHHAYTDDLLDLKGALLFPSSPPNKWKSILDFVLPGGPPNSALRPVMCFFCPPLIFILGHNCTRENLS